MQLKPYQPDNLTAMLALFHRTVHTVNAKDYTPQQQDAWAPGDVTRDRSGGRAGTRLCGST